MIDFILPVSTLYVGLNGLIGLVLAMLVSRRRMAAKISIGDGGDPELMRVIRAHANFSEYAPLALLFIVVLELGPAPSWLLHALGATFTVGRLAHAQGMIASARPGPARGLGVLATWLVYIVGPLACLYYAWS
jgi:uncharacterized membrane protein YecN with MAPEG domain